MAASAGMEWISLSAAAIGVWGVWMQMTAGMQEAELASGVPLAELRAENQLLAEVKWWRRRKQRREFRESRPPELAAHIELLERKVNGWMAVWVAAVLAATGTLFAALT